MRIRIKQKPPLAHLSPTFLELFEPGLQYEVGHSNAVVFFSEGWAEPVASEEPALLIPLRTLFVAGSDDAITADIAFDEVPSGDGPQYHARTNDLRNAARCD